MPVLSDGMPSINEAALRDGLIFPLWELWEDNPFDLFELGLACRMSLGLLPYGVPIQLLS